MAMKISKLDAFTLVAQAEENGDTQTANEILKIISRSIKQDRENNLFSVEIELLSKKEERYFKNYLRAEEQEN